MTQQRVTFEWVLDESKTDPINTPADNAQRAFGLDGAEQRIAIRLLRGLVLLVIIVAAASAAGITPAERERRQAQKGIAQTLLVESKAWQQRDRSLYESLIDPTLDDDWVDTWRDYWRAGDGTKPDFDAELLDVHQDTLYEESSYEESGYMQATVLTQQPAFEWWQTNPYREERFYRRVDSRWLRTVPPASQWGDTRQLETKHLRFVYYDRDAEAVEAAAPKLEKAFVGMYRALNLSDPPDNAQSISVLPHPIGRWTATVAQLEVTSPLLAQIPEGQSDGDYLAYDIMNWLTYRAISDAVPAYGLRYLYRWPILIWGLRGWLRDELLDQPSPWHIQAVEILRQSAHQFLPLRLEQITDVHNNIHPSREEVILRYLAAESFMTFIVETYGNQRLTNLLDALTHYSRWDQIIRVTYGLSVPEFEAKWNEHIVRKYELEETIQR